MSELEKKYDKEIIKILEGFGYLGDTDYGTEYFSCIGNQEANTPFEILNLLNKFKQLQQENTQLKQQLKDKDEKISKAIEYIKTKELPDYGIFPLDDDDYRKDILEILESNKED